MNPPSTFTDWLVYLVSGGGLLALLREGRQWWNRRQVSLASAPEKRAVVESKMVATAEQVVALVEERMEKQAAEAEKARVAAASEIRELRGEISTLRHRVDVLEDELRDHNIPIP